MWNYSVTKVSYQSITNGVSYESTYDGATILFKGYISNAHAKVTNWISMLSSEEIGSGSVSFAMIF